MNITITVQNATIHLASVDEVVAIQNALADQSELLHEILTAVVSDPTTIAEIKKRLADSAVALRNATTQSQGS